MVRVDVPRVHPVSNLSSCWGGPFQSEFAHQRPSPTAKVDIVRDNAVIEPVELGSRGGSRRAPQQASSALIARFAGVAPVAQIRMGRAQGCAGRSVRVPGPDAGHPSPLTNSRSATLPPGDERCSHTGRTRGTHRHSRTRNNPHSRTVDNLIKPAMCRRSRLPRGWRYEPRGAILHGQWAVLLPRPEWQGATATAAAGCGNRCADVGMRSSDSLSTSSTTKVDRCCGFGQDAFFESRQASQSARRSSLYSGPDKPSVNSRAPRP